MDWRDEAKALIYDIKHYVNSIKLSQRHESSDTRIYFEIETLEGDAMIVLMDANGFMICDNELCEQLELSEGIPERREPEISEDDFKRARPKIKIYETINSLLDESSPKYREAFASDLFNRMRSLE